MVRVKRDKPKGPTPSRVAVYSRYSDEMQSARSCDDQIRECTDYAARQGWSVVLVEKDEAVRSGAIASRDGYARVLEAAKRGEIDVMLVFEIARFSRDFLGGMVELSKITKAKVKLADTSIGLIDLETAHGQMMVSVHLMNAHQEVRKLSINSKRGLKGKVLDKFSSGGRPAFGHKRQPLFSDTEKDADGRPKRIGVPHVPDPDAAPVVVRMFKMYGTGCSKSEIARALNNERVPSRDAGKSRRVRGGVAKQKNSGTWSDASVKQILENPIYIGTRIWNRFSRTGDKLPSGKKAMVENPDTEWIIVKEWCDPLIERELWDRVQERLAKDREEYDRKRTAKVNRRYLLSGFIQCVECGGSFVIGSHFRGQRQYRCGMRTRSACSNTTCVPQEALESKVRWILDALCRDPKQLAELVREHNKAVNEFNSDRQSEVKRLEAQLASLQETISRLVKAVEDGAGEVKSIVTSLRTHEADVDALEEQIGKARAALQPYLMPRPKPFADYIQGAASLFTGEFVRDRRVLDQALESIKVHGDGSLVLEFRPELFGAVRYELLGSGLAVADADLRKFRRAFHSGLSRLTGLPKKIRDFGRGQISVEADLAPPQNSSGVPSGI